MGDGRDTRALRAFRDSGWLDIKRQRTFDPTTGKWKNRSVYSLRFENVQNELDEITKLRLERRRKPATDVRSANVLKPATGGRSLTPSKNFLEGS